MLILNIGLVLVISYLLGSIPFGWLVVAIGTGKDVRGVGSGRTGGTNAMRAAGLFAGLLTALGDVLKAAATALVVQYFTPGNLWVQVAAALLAIVGHNYPIFMIKISKEGKVNLSGGAGGAPCLGGAIALWPPIWLIVLPLGVLVYIGVGFASVTTMSLAVLSTIIFAFRAIMGWGPWEYVVYGLVAEALVVWALRPNLIRLKEGNERPVGLRAYFQKRKERALEMKRDKE
ncbi:MAG: glycerol-3-phosphate acyltransferase [Anaerolineaceae bacterium]